MQTDYLPYGGLISGSGLNVTENDYLWTGKELQHQIFDTPAYDSSARLLFTNGLFASLDPLAEKYPGISPYAYCAGDPVNLLDTNGCSISTHTDASGNVVAVYNDGDLGVYRHNGDRDYTENEVSTLHSDNNTSAGGTKMGES
ncbi:MAG: hypothetical protein II556_03130, partial [Bacteroidales bacterium]|nr:hypothetical protein [Bacteroidales bacterium]